jgi:hypothetical protein
MLLFTTEGTEYAEKCYRMRSNRPLQFFSVDSVSSVVNVLPKSTGSQ